MLNPGDPVPGFQAASSVNPKFNFDTVAGRHVVISFFGSSQHSTSARFLAEIERRGDRFDVINAIFFGVSTDPQDVQRLTHQDPGRLWFYDLDLAIGRLFGVIEDAPVLTAASVAAASPDGLSTSGNDPVRPAVAARKDNLRTSTFVLDHALRVVAIIALGDDATRQVDTIFSVLDSLPKFAALTAVAPVLVVPYVFEPDLCKALIQYYENKGGEDSGFMMEVDGKTVGKYDYSHKRRMDCEITEAKVIKVIHERIVARLIPAIKQAYQFNVSRIERNIIACYDAAQGAHFKAHRDNTTLGTAHRRFAVTLNLNSPDYEGGEIRFPEFGPLRFKAPSGAAIVFSCSLLHEVPAVTRGKRYAYLPFLYDEAARAVRERNYRYVAGPEAATPGGQPDQCNATPTHAAASAFSTGSVSIPVLDGTCGCGNPNGCQTCLSAATYPLGAPETRTTVR